MGHSTHMTGNTRASSSRQSSHVTTEDIDQLNSHLERAKAEETQVLEIQSRLEAEVQMAHAKSQKAKHRLLLQNQQWKEQTLLREKYQRELSKLQEENQTLRSRLNIMEEEEEEQGLDHVLDSMGEKIKQLKLNKLLKSRSQASRRNSTGGGSGGGDI